MLREHGGSDVMHQGEGKPFLAKVLDAGTYVIDLIIDEQEAVVRLAELMDADDGVLAVVTLNVQLQLLADVLGIDGSTDVGCSLVEQGEHGVVDIVVDEGNGFSGFAHEVGDETVGIEYLSVIEDALYRRQRGAHEEVDLVLGTADPLLQSLYSLIDGITFQ